MLNLPTDPQDKSKLRKALRDVSAAMLIVEGQREVIKDIKNEICEDLQIEKKVFNRMAKVFHRGNFQEEVMVNDEFEALYQEVVGSEG